MPSGPALCHQTSSRMSHPTSTITSAAETPRTSKTATSRRLNMYSAEPTYECLPQAAKVPPGPHTTIEEEELPAMLNKHLDLQYTFKGNQIIVTSPIDNASKEDTIEEEAVEDLAVFTPNVSIQETQEKGTPHASPKAPTKTAKATKFQSRPRRIQPFKKKPRRPEAMSRTDLHFATLVQQYKLNQENISNANSQTHLYVDMKNHLDKISESSQQQVEIAKELLELEKKEDKRRDEELEMKRKEHQKKMELLELQISERANGLWV